MMKDANQRANKHWEYVPRKPRHEAADTCGLELRVETDRKFVNADMLDCSRQGTRLQLSESVPIGEEVTLHFSAPSEMIDWSTMAKIRWCCANATGWECGCEFPTELAWEHLGQLLLGGFLSTD
jgi:hypothetical protein